MCIRDRDSSLVMFLYREFVYNTQADPSHAELILAKQRNGPSGVKIPLTSEGRCAKFLPNGRVLGEGLVTPSTIPGTAPRDYSLLTLTGTLEPLVVPSPNWPKMLFPQHLTAPPESSAQVWSPPAEIAIAPVRPVTLTGTFESVVVPLPNSPTTLYPQHWTVPPESRAQECWKPAAMAVTPVRLLTLTGTLEPYGGEVLVVPLPNSP